MEGSFHFCKDIGWYNIFQLRTFNAFSNKKLLLKLDDSDFTEINPIVPPLTTGLCQQTGTTDRQ